MLEERPTELLISFYGDDFTGSTDVMEALSSQGVPTVLFVRQPSADRLRRFPHVRAVGLAGTSRSETPAWMDAHLPPAFAWLHGLGARVCHYKVCSTFDSSPTIGSIGRAIDIGAGVFRQSTVPLLVGAPQLKRYTAFGNLFAAFRGEVYRIDRHPVMSRHPVTPMQEADLRVHLARQTAKRIGLVDLAALGRVDASAEALWALVRGDAIVLIDVADIATQAAAGRALAHLARDGALFVAGSSGVEYALLSAWVGAGIVSGRAAFEPPGTAERIAVVSGSCSPTTERQIRHALADGFGAVALDPRELVGAGSEAALERAVVAGLAVLQQGGSVILHTALGPQTDVGPELDRADLGRHGVGRMLGVILRRLIEAERLTRVVIAGGDTSSHALSGLEVFALTTRLPLPKTPGSPLCTAHSDNPAFEGLQIALKGGQVGEDDYFSRIRSGIP